MMNDRYDIIPRIDYTGTVDSKNIKVIYMKSHTGTKGHYRVYVDNKLRFEPFSDSFKFRNGKYGFEHNSNITIYDPYTDTDITKSFHVILLPFDGYDNFLGVVDEYIYSLDSELNIVNKIYKRNASSALYHNMLWCVVVGSNIISFDGTILKGKQPKTLSYHNGFLLRKSDEKTEALNKNIRTHHTENSNRPNEGTCIVTNHMTKKGIFGSTIGLYEDLAYAPLNEIIKSNENELRDAMSLYYSPSTVPYVIDMAFVHLKNNKTDSNAYLHRKNLGEGYENVYSNGTNHINPIFRLDETDPGVFKILDVHDFEIIEQFKFVDDGIVFHSSPEGWGRVDRYDMSVSEFVSNSSRKFKSYATKLQIDNRKYFMSFVYIGNSEFFHIARTGIQKATEQETAIRAFIQELDYGRDTNFNLLFRQKDDGSWIPGVVVSFVEEKRYRRYRRPTEENLPINVQVYSNGEIIELIYLEHNTTVQYEYDFNIYANIIKETQKLRKDYKRKNISFINDVDNASRLLGRSMANML